MLACGTSACNQEALASRRVGFSPPPQVTAAYRCRPIRCPGPPTAIHQARSWLVSGLGSGSIHQNPTPSRTFWVQWPMSSPFLPYRCGGSAGVLTGFPILRRPRRRRRHHERGEESIGGGAAEGAPRRSRISDGGSEKLDGGGRPRAGCVECARRGGGGRIRPCLRVGLECRQRVVCCQSAYEPVDVDSRHSLREKVRWSYGPRRRSR